MTALEPDNMEPSNCKCEDPRFNALFLMSRDAVGIATDGKIVCVNPVYASLLGYSDPVEMIGLDVLTLGMPTNCATQEAEHERHTSGVDKGLVYHTRALCKDGQEIDVENQVTSFEQDSKTYMLIVARDATQQVAAAAALEQRTKDLTLLYEAGRLLGSTLDPDQVYDRLRVLVAAQMECDSLIVSAYSAEERLIRCAYAWVEGSRLDPSVFPPVPLAPIGHGLQSTAIHTGKSRLIHDMDEAVKANTVTYHITPDGDVHDEPEEGKPHSSSALLVPIKLEGKVLGIAQVTSNRKAAYTEEHLHLLEALLLQVAAASRNAYLYQLARKQVNEREKAHTEIANLNARLRQAMTETHHRVKNNLQIISSMLEMQVMEYGESIPASENRRLSMHIRTLASLHDVLTQQAKDDAVASDVSATVALKRMVELLQEAATPRCLILEAENIRLQVRQGTALALILNELVSNALKHGAGDVQIRFFRDEPFVVLQVRDHGKGFPIDFQPQDAAHTGMELLDMAVRWDLAGKVEYTNHSEGGAIVVVRFPLYRG